MQRPAPFGNAWGQIQQIIRIVRRCDFEFRICRGGDFVFRLGERSQFHLDGRYPGIHIVVAHDPDVHNVASVAADVEIRGGIFSQVDKIVRLAVQSGTLHMQVCGGFRRVLPVFVFRIGNGTVHALHVFRRIKTVREGISRNTGSGIIAQSLRCRPVFGKGANRSGRVYEL